jgi:hypothetical protein
MFWRFIALASLIAIVVISTILGSDILLENSKWDRIADLYRFNIVEWEIENLFSKWTYRIEQALSKDSLSDNDKVELVEHYMSVSREANSINTKLERGKLEGNHSTEEIRIWEERLNDLIEEREQLENRVEEIIEGQISAVLADEGLSLTLDLGGETDIIFPPVDYTFEARGGEADIIFPPVDYTFEARPNVLIVSRRDTIAIVDTTLLIPDMDLEEIIALEDEVESSDFSALVEQVGAVATYPSMVPRQLSLHGFLSKVAHEWLHHYMFFRPLGQKYWSDYEMRTINETVADIVGNEIGRMAYSRFYKGEKNQETVYSEEATQSSFDFAEAMRDIRIRVDNFLANGEIENAELYMEEQRIFLQEQGYYIRKLNQAYFAFHGTYADTPTSVNPIGDQVRELRAQNSNLVDFINVAAGISSYDELIRLTVNEEAV